MKLQDLYDATAEGLRRWEPEEQFQWKQWHELHIGMIPKYEREPKMDLKRAISRLETVARRPSWQNTEQARAIAVVIEAAKKQLPPEPKNHLCVFKWHNSKEFGVSPYLETKTLAEDWAVRNKRFGVTIAVKVPV